jgi:hypothetical protein
MSAVQRHVVLALITLLAFQDYAAACAKSTQRPFDPGIIVKVYFDPDFIPDPYLRSCLGFGSEDWFSLESPIEVIQDIGGGPNVIVKTMPAWMVSDLAANGIPDARMP